MISGSGGAQNDSSAPASSWDVPATVPIMPLRRPPT